MYKYLNEFGLQQNCRTKHFCNVLKPLKQKFSGRNRRTRATAPTHPGEPTAHRSAQARPQKPRNSSPPPHCCGHGRHEGGQECHLDAPGARPIDRLTFPRALVSRLYNHPWPCRGKACVLQTGETSLYISSVTADAVSSHSHRLPKQQKHKRGDLCPHPFILHNGRRDFNRARTPSCTTKKPCYITTPYQHHPLHHANSITPESTRPHRPYLIPSRTVAGTLCHALSALYHAVPCYCESCAPPASNLPSFVNVPTPSPHTSPIFDLVAVSNRSQRVSHLLGFTLE